MAAVESYAPLMAHAPKTFNFFINQPWMRKLSEKHIGMVDLPLLSVPSLKQQMVGHRSANTTLEQLEALSAEQKAKRVLVVQDPFTSYYDAQVVADFVHLVEKLGYQPVLLPFSPNGKAQHIKGFLTRFARTAQKTADFLNRVAQLGMPMVGVDPALVLCYRDEYNQVLGDKRGDFRVMLVHEWLPQALSATAAQEQGGESWYLFGHCTEVTALPASTKQWADIFARFGAKLENVNVGCCGMAGTYGHEVRSHANSLASTRSPGSRRCRSLPRNRCLVTGYSCRSQVKRIEGSRRTPSAAGATGDYGMIWKRQSTLEQLNTMGDGNMVGLLDIRFEAITDDAIIATMPVDSRTHQPFGLLHGGASVVLAETLGSVAGYLCSEGEQKVVGLEVNANHIRSVRSGRVRGVCRALHVGARHQVWQIDISDEQGRLCCSSRLTTAVI